MIQTQRKTIKWTDNHVYHWSKRLGLFDFKRRFGLAYKQVVGRYTQEN